MSYLTNYIKKHYIKDIRRTHSSDDSKIEIKSFERYGYQFHYNANHDLNRQQELKLALAAAIKGHKDSTVSQEVLINDFVTSYEKLLKYDDIMSRSESTKQLLNIYLYKPDTDDFLKQLISYDIGCLHIEELKTNRLCKIKLYQIDLDYMIHYDVRPGFKQYGGRLIFDANLNIYAIDYMCKVYRPNRQYWIEVKQIFRSSLILATLIKFYLVQTKLVYGSLFTFCIQQLPRDHYLRKIFMPYANGRLDYLNLLDKTILGPDRLLERMTAFTPCGLRLFMADCLRDFKMIDFSLGKDLADTCPYFRDAPELFNCIKTYISNYLATYHDCNDITVNQFVHQVNSLGLKLKLNSEAESLTLFISQYIFNVTCITSIAKSAVLKLAFHPGIFSSRLKEHDHNPDRQTYFETVTLGILLSLDYRPRMLDDFSYLFSEMSDKITVLNYLKSLGTLASIIEKRNLSRSFLYQGCNPRYLEI